MRLRCERRKEELTRISLKASSSGVSSQSYVPGKQVIVSLTTHSKRLYEVFLAIESIMQGTYLPNRIILWLGDDAQSIDLPDTLHRQLQRGLEIRYTQDLGPHTKLIPAILAFPDDIIITIDDDMFYAYDMVENLIKAHNLHPADIISNRVTVMTFDPSGLLRSYMKWEHYSHPVVDTRRNLITGVEGCLYPPHSLHPEVFNSQVFRSICAYADDVWFTAMAILQGTLVRSLFTHYERGCAGGINNMSVQDIGLWHANDNEADCRNDQQIKAVFSQYNIYPLLTDE